jgi:NAD-dependent dihydropyrimidine dehydrogenase PreA subunit
MAWLTGYPREQVAWYPTVDPSKCVKCGMCMNCGKGVYDWTEGGAKVARPYNCVVGCNTCANLCLGDAISFPDIQEIRALYKRERIWQRAKKELQGAGKLIIREG